MDIRDFEHLIDENTKVILARDGAKVMVLKEDMKVVLETITDDRIKRLTTQLDGRLTLRSYDFLLEAITKKLLDAQLKVYLHTMHKDHADECLRNKTVTDMTLAFTDVVDLIFTYFYQTDRGNPNTGIAKLIDSIIERYERS